MEAPRVVLVGGPVTLDINKIVEICKADQNGGSYLGLCPAHNDTKKSLAFWVDDHGSLAIKCYAGCTRSDVLQALEDNGATGLTKSKAARGSSDAESRKIQIAQSIWDSSHELTGKTPADKYLKGRGLKMPPLGTAKYWEQKGLTEAEDQRCLINPIFDWQGHIQGVQRLYINRDGSKAKVDVQRKINGKRRGGGVMLPGTEPIIICEGFETGMSVWQSTGRQTICTLGLPNLDKLPLGDGMTVVVARDLDKKGSKADKQLWRAVRRIRDRGVKVLVASPTKYEGLKKSDFNDVLQKDGEESVKKLIEEAKEEDEGDPLDDWIKHALDPVEAVRQLNQKYLVVKDAGKTIVFEERWDPVANREVRVRLTFTDFRHYFMNQHVQSGATRTTPLGDWWLESPQRRQYEHVVFSPVVETPDDYNLWKGWAYEPEPGDWSLLRHHIRDNLCRGERELYDYFIKWMARGVQSLDTPGQVAVVLRGKRGVGKGTIASAYGKLFGQHFLHASQSRHITGNFNAHLRDCLFLFADEAFWAGDKQGESSLKTLITEPVIPIEGKGKDVISEKNRVKLMVASNQQWVVPAGFEERRFAVYDVSEDQMQSTAYFKAIAAQMTFNNDAGYKGMLHDLLEMDLSDFNVFKVPTTVGLFEQKLSSMQPHEKWWFERLNSGKVAVEHQDWEVPWTPSQLHGAYLEWTQRLRVGRPLPQSDLVRLISKLVPQVDNKPAWKRVRLRAENGVRPWAYELPPLDKCRDFFSELMRQTIEWETEIGEGSSTPRDDDIPF